MIDILRYSVLFFYILFPFERFLRDVGIYFRPNKKASGGLELLSKISLGKCRTLHFPFNQTAKLKEPLSLKKC